LQAVVATIFVTVGVVDVPVVAILPPRLRAQG
jgi:hypothetical protein